MTFRSIGTKIQLLAGTAFLLGLGGVLTTQTYTRIEATRAERLDANLRIVHGLSAPARGAIALRDKSVINSYMELLTSDPRAAGVVLSSNNSVMVSQQSIDHFDLPIQDLSDFALKTEAGGQTKVQDAGDYEFIAVPVTDPALHTIGSIAVAWSVKGLLDNVWYTAIKEALSLIAVVALVLMVLVYSMRRMVTSPLNKIAILIDKPPALGVGDIQNSGVEFEDRSDEIGTFARALGRFYRNAAEKHLLHGQLDSALTNMSQGLCMFDKDGNLVVSNSRFAQMYGLSSNDLKPGMSKTDVINSVASADLFTAADPTANPQQQLAWITGSESDSTTHELTSGKTFTVSRQPTADGGWVATHTDVTDLRRAEKKLSHLAGHDVLTGLPNRRRFHECIDQALQQESASKDLAVLFLDLDKFKAVNDTLGHAAGDELLKTVSARLLACVRQGDVVCRLGGDEFAILQRSGQQPEGAQALAVRITKSLSEPVTIGDQKVKIGVSTGIALSAHDGNDAAALLKCADMAVYVAKSEGRNTHRFYTLEMSERQQQRQRLEMQLRTALEANQFELHYQPIVDIRTNRITCMEALVRWNNPELGLVPPADFIPIAEETGLITAIGEWSIREACQQAAKWPADIRVAVNISAVQFQRCDLARIVFSALASAHIAPSRLELEITESVLLGNDEATIDLLHKLRGFGVRIVLDDFGTGYSALSYLNKFPFDKIKIDRAFVSGLNENKVNDAIINAVVNISRSLNISTVAEGVETRAQCQHLLDAGIDEIQGHLFSPARTSDEVQMLFFGSGLHQNSSTSA
jgi:diguanylate cyclase (GGDEF)-like protein